MTNQQIGLRTLAGVVAALVWAAPGAAWGQIKSLPAYDRLRSDRLIKQLSSLGMIELLQAMDAEVPAGDASAEALARRGQIRLGLADAMADEADRDRLIDEAAPLLRQAIKLAQKDAKAEPDKALAMYRWTLELAAALGWTRLDNPHVLRLRHLQGGQGDRTVVLKYTKEAVERLEILKDDIADTLMDWRSNMDFLMVYVPQLEDLQDQVRYNAAWVRLHRAMAMEDGPERTQLCRDIIADARRFTTDEQSGVKYWALLLTGEAYRMMKDHAKADGFLNAAGVPESRSEEIRLRALFARARNRIEEGKPDVAAKAIEEFRRTAAAIVGPDKEVQADLGEVLLRGYLLELQAAAQKNAESAAELRQKAQEVLLSFVEKYADRPGIIKAFLDMVAAKFAGAEDLDKASAVVLMARAYTKVDSKDPAEQAEAQDLLLRVLRHGDLKSPKIARAIRPGVLWELALLMNTRKQNIDASRYFVALCQMYPDNRMAERASKNAVISMNAVLTERREQNQPVGATLRMEFIRALDTFLGKWGKEPGDAKWNYDLATQCVRIAEATDQTAAKFYWQGLAIAAFEKVPDDLPEYMDAQHTALGLRTEVVLNRETLAAQLKGDNEKANAALRRLAGLVSTYEKVDLSGAGNGGGPTTAPAEDEGGGAGGEAIAQRADAIRKDLSDRLAVYSDPAALVARLKTYSGEAAKAGEESARKAASAEAKEKEELTLYAGQLKEWSADADFLAARIKYEELPKGKKPQERDAIEKEALDDLRAIIRKWPGTPILRQAFEFEIRKLIERGQTQEAIAKIKDFKAQYPEQAGELIQLVVTQIREQIRRLEKGLKEAVTNAEVERIRESLNGYRRAFENFARDLYEQVRDLPVVLDKLDQRVREIDALERKGDFDALLRDANQHAALCAEHKAEMTDIKAKDLDDLSGILAVARQPNADRKQILPDLAAAYVNVVTSVRSLVQERYSRWQMYGEALIQKGLAEEMSGDSLDAKGAFQGALELFQKTYDLDEQRRKAAAEWLEVTFRPRIEAVKAAAKSMDAVGKLIAELKKEMTDQAEDPAKSSDVTTLEFAFEFLRKSSNPEEEKVRLPRAVDLLLRGWENLLERLKTRQPVDPMNIVGLARAHRGLKQYDKAMEFYRRYTDGIDKARFPVEFWRMHLERCQCHLEGYSSNAEAMTNLVIHIKVLQLNSPDDKTMGGFAEEFEAIRREAEKLAKKGASSKAP